MALIDDYNKDVSTWTKATKRKLKLNVVQMTAVYSGQARSQLDAKTKKYAGEASKINFTFPYYMVFVHKGAGRGYGSNGHNVGGRLVTQFTRRDGSKKETAAGSRGKMGTGSRRPKPWYNPVLEERFPQLADIVSNYKGNRITLAIERILVH